MKEKWIKPELTELNVNRTEGGASNTTWEDSWNNVPETTTS